MGRGPVITYIHLLREASFQTLHVTVLQKFQEARRRAHVEGGIWMATG